MDYGEKNNLKKITKAVIELGRIVEHGEEILAENLEFNIKMMAEGGLAENINLEIIKVHGPEWILKEIEGE
jgi:Zn finger protein HypA/HybF involved in hydrogenase expression